MISNLLGKALRSGNKRLLSQNVFEIRKYNDLKY